MVRKAGREWRICVDFTNLNKYCPKDFYSLSSINQKIEVVLGNEVLNFLDLYKGYRQVLMDPKDAWKMAFISNWGIFTYKKLPFRLRIARATYQCLIDMIFKDKVGKIVEVYIDDIDIKRLSQSNYHKDLGEILNIIRKVGLKFNPLKCIFRLNLGKFLSYKVSN